MSNQIVYKVEEAIKQIKKDVFPCVELVMSEKRFNDILAANRDNDIYFNKVIIPGKNSVKVYLFKYKTVGIYLQQMLDKNTELKRQSELHHMLLAGGEKSREFCQARKLDDEIAFAFLGGLMKEG